MHKDSGGKITCRRQEKPLPFPEEQIHLAQTLERLEEALAEAGENADRLEQEEQGDRKSTRLNSSHLKLSRMPSSA